MQIHHLDENPSNNDPSNLAVVCTECHNDAMMKGGFGRKLGASEVRIYRDDWIRRVADRRSQADQLALQKQIGLAVEKIGDVKEWRPPSDIALYTFVDSIPDIMKRAYGLAQSEWDSQHGFRGHLLQCLCEGKIPLSVKLQVSARSNWKLSLIG